MTSDSRFDEDMRRFEEQLRRNPGSLVFARLADGCRRSGDYERALQLLEEGLSRHPQYVSAHIVRARVYEALGRRDRATAAFEHVLELDDQNLVALRSLAELALTAGNVALARRRYERLLAVDPRNPEVRSIVDRLGRSGMEETQPRTSAQGTGAVSDFLPAADEAETDAEGELRAWISAGTLSTMRAVAPVSDAGVLAPEDDGDLLTQTMAELYASQGLFEEAAEIYEELLKERPGDESLQKRLDSVRASRSGPAPEPARGPWPESGRAAEEGAPQVEALEEETEALTPPEPEATTEQAIQRSEEPPSPHSGTDVDPDESPAEESSLSPVVADWLRRMKE